MTFSDLLRINIVLATVYVWTFFKISVLKRLHKGRLKESDLDEETAIDRMLEKRLREEQIHQQKLLQNEKIFSDFLSWYHQTVSKN